VRSNLDKLKFSCH